jgi:hypothetical protein
MIKRYFNSYQDGQHANNEILAYRKAQYGAFEVIAWQEQFEVFYRPFRKRYGYFIGHYAELSNAVNVMKETSENDMAREFINMQ